MKRDLSLQGLRVKCFKAIQDSQQLRFEPLTVLIGNNGSGKSSVIEALETYQSIVDSGLDFSMVPWRGFEHLLNWAVPHTKPKGAIKERPSITNPMSFSVWGVLESMDYGAQMKVSASPATEAQQVGDELFILGERIRYGDGPTATTTRDARGVATTDTGLWEDLGKAGQRPLPPVTAPRRFSDDESVIPFMFPELAESIRSWQFLSLAPQLMGAPAPQRRTSSTIRLAKDGSNIAEYLLSIRRQDVAAFEGILEALQRVLPYARDLQPSITSELERTVFLQLTEQSFKVPGWLLSTGTLRVLALLALLRHPKPPPLIVIEELENGLDPRTIALVIEEIRVAVEAGRTQVIATSHSPYLLDLLTLSHIILVERVDGEPRFSRPNGRKELREWADKFSPGQMYTSGMLARKDSK